MEALYRHRSADNLGHPGLPDVAFSHDDNGRAASESSDQDRCSARRGTWRRGSVTSTCGGGQRVRQKGGKAAASPDERVAVIELEQAGDSAKAAAEADLARHRLHGKQS